MQLLVDGLIPSTMAEPGSETPDGYTGSLSASNGVVERIGEKEAIWVEASGWMMSWDRSRVISRDSSMS